jgi:hypothetical protein
MLAGHIECNLTTKAKTMKQPELLMTRAKKSPAGISRNFLLELPLAFHQIYFAGYKAA